MMFEIKIASGILNLDILCYSDISMLKMPKDNSEFTRMAQDFMNFHRAEYSREMDYTAFAYTLLEIAGVGSFEYADSCITYPNRDLSKDNYYYAVYLNNGPENLSFLSVTISNGKYSNSEFISFRQPDRNLLNKITAPSEFKNEVIHFIL